MVYSMSESLRIVVILDSAASNIEMVKALKEFTGIGYSESRSQVAAGAPVVVEETFTNSWFDSRGGQLVGLLTSLAEQRVSFRLWEASADVNPQLEHLLEDGDEISLEILRNIVASRDAAERG